MIRLNVLLRFDEKKTVPVGQLAEDEHRVYFQYDPDFLAEKLWLSPYKLPLKPELFEHTEGIKDETDKHFSKHHFPIGF